MLVLGYVWLPFVALPIFVSLESLDRRLLEAASDLGASRWQAFRRVTLRSPPGVVAAFLFVFIPTLGEFVTPSLVGGHGGYMYGNQIVDLFGTGFLDWQTGSVLSLFLLGVVAALTIVFSRFLQTAGDRRLMDVALSRPAAWILRVFFVLVVVFLYAPILVLLMFSFNDSDLPSFPLSGFTLHWYHQFLTNADLRTALRTSAIVAVISSLGAVLLGILASLALVRGGSGARRRSRRLLLSPLVIPYVVFGISLLLFFHAVGIASRRPDCRDRAHRDQRAVHDPRARATPPADRRLARGGGPRPRREPAPHVSLDHAAPDPPCRRLGVPHRLLVSFDEYAVASFVAARRRSRSTSTGRCDSRAGCRR